MLAAALKDGIGLNSLFWGGNGEVEVQNKIIREYDNKHKYGWITAKKTIQVSSNVGAVKMALKVGSKKYRKMLVDFGFGKKTGLNFPGEISGWLPGKRMKPLTLATAGLGQSIMATPLQIVRAFATFANGGYLVKPELILNSEPVRKPIITSQIAKSITEALLSVTNEGGTGQPAAIEGYQIAGKSGTAQVVDPVTKRYSRNRYIPSFVGYTVGVEPKIVVYASVKFPQGNYYSTSTAAPLFQKVMKAVIHRYSIPNISKPLLSREIKNHDEIHKIKAQRLIRVESEGQTRYIRFLT